MRISKTGGFRSRPRTALASGLALVAAAAIPAVTAPAASAATAVAITVNATTGLGTVSSDAIGLNNRQPAPESIIGLLPTGSSRNTQDVLRQFDSVPIDPNAGTYPTPGRQPGN